MMSKQLAYCLTSLSACNMNSTCDPRTKHFTIQLLLLLLSATTQRGMHPLSAHQFLGFRINLSLQLGIFLHLLQLCCGLLAGLVLPGRQVSCSTALLQ